MNEEAAPCSPTCGKRSPCIFPSDSLNLPFLPPWLYWPAVYEGWDVPPTPWASQSTKSHEFNPAYPTRALRCPAGEHAVSLCLPDLRFVQMWLKAEVSSTIHQCPLCGLKNGCTCAAFAALRETNAAPRLYSLHQPCRLEPYQGIGRPGEVV